MKQMIPSILLWSPEEHLNIYIYIYIYIYIKQIKNTPSALLSYISVREFLRTEKHRPKASASCTSCVFLKIPKCLYNSTMLEEQVFLFLL